MRPLEHGGDLIERREIEFHDLMTELFQCLAGGGKRGGLCGVAEEDAGFLVGHTDLQALEGAASFIGAKRFE